MRRAGTVVRIAQGMVIARCPDEWHPGIGAEVVDETLEAVGRVVDVIGPTAQPFVVISPRDTTPLERLLNHPVYVR